MAGYRRFYEHTDPTAFEYSVKRGDSKNYMPVTIERLAGLLRKAMDDRAAVAAIRMRDASRCGSWTNMDMRDVGTMLAVFEKHIEEEKEMKEKEMRDEQERTEAEEVEEQTVEEAPEAEEAEDTGIEAADDEVDDGPHTEFRFCCRSMMEAMLGGGGIAVSMETGEIQIGSKSVLYCPFCGAEVITHTPPAKVE